VANDNVKLRVKPGTTWDEVYERAHRAVPEALVDGRMLNCLEGRWLPLGTPRVPTTTPIDGSEIAGAPYLDTGAAGLAVSAAADEHRAWGLVPLAERAERVRQAVDFMAEERDLMALLLVWEIGKPWRLACADVDRALDGVRWYLDNIDEMAAGRVPLPGPVSNIASWNYPMSVLMHSMLVQALAGNAVIAKTPSQGGAATLTVATALARRAGLPFTLISGQGSRLSQVLVQSPQIGALAFVGGRTNGGRVASALVDTGKRHMLEQEGLNAWGVWNFTQWDSLAAHLKKGFEYGKQRCTAYPRYVVQRGLFDQFLEMYLGVLKSLRWGHPLAVEHDDDPLPELDFGPVISPAKVAELQNKIEEAVMKGAVPIYRAPADAGRYLPGQDTSSYLAPVSLLNPPASCALRHAEPFGPVDTIVVVDTEAQLLAEMNASNGSLVASIASDDEDAALRMSGELQSFKVGINKPRSRGDREEPFGGRGPSWKGCFVGGKYLVEAVTLPESGEDRLYGNFPGYSLYPPT
jgi:acyl-CoA reductase-like NAD-dependent aldehyde dehydrogenase